MECLYSVPEFQRPYSWGSDELEEYWSDVVLANSDFFFGATVTYLSEKRDLFRNTFALIDGQQRITTSAIALSVMRDYFAKLAKEVPDDDEIGSDVRKALTDQVGVTQKYLIARDDDGKKYEVLKRSEPMFYEVIQAPGSIPSGVKWNQSARLIGEARVFFEKKTLDLLMAVKSPASQLEHLKELRNNILKARLIQVELSSEEDATLVFETLNARGAQLLVSDLVKNLLVRSVGDSAADRVTVANRWNRLIDSVVGEGGKLEDADRFIWQSWNSRREAVTVRELYKAVKRYCAAAPGQYLSYLEELECDAKPYALLEGVSTIFPPRRHNNRTALALPVVQDSVLALSLFKVSVANSAIMAIVRKFDASPYMKQQNVEESVRAIEKFHFQFTQLAKEGSTGGTRGRYNRFAVELAAAQNATEIKQVISDLQEKLKGSLPGRDKVIKGFSELIYAPNLKLNQAEKLRGSSALIKYVLLSMSKYEKKLPAAQGSVEWTVEHIKPQSQATRGSADPVFSIGNLVLLSQPANQELSNFPFEKKRDSLARFSVNRDAVLDEWLSSSTMEILTDADIKSRREALAAWAVDAVWSI